MTVTRFDRLAPLFITGSCRRNLLRGLAGTVVGLVAFQVPGSAEAKKNHKEDARKKGKRRKKKKMQPTPTAPPPPDPVTTTDAVCLFVPPGLAEQTGPRLAQTFVAKRTGQLTSATVMLYSSAEGADFALEIREVDVGGTPTTAVLASTVIANVPATPVAQLRTIGGTFASPATVVAGEVYALVVTETSGLAHSFFINGFNACLDGTLFRDELVNDTFDPRPNQDLVYATFVTA